MKHIKSFSQLNESVNYSGLNKKFHDYLDKIETISDSILNDKEFNDRIDLIKKEDPELGKNIKKHLELAIKLKTMCEVLRDKEISKDKQGPIQLEAVGNLVKSIEKTQNELKEIKNKTNDAFSSNEGLLNIVGNVLRNIFTGTWVINALKNLKSNLVDTNTEIQSVQDLFDIKDY